MKSLSSTLGTNVVPAASYSAGSYTLTGLIVGSSYSYSMGANDTSIAFSGGATFAKSALVTGTFTASATSATLAGSGTSTVGTIITQIFGIQLYPATVVPTLPARQVTIGYNSALNPNYTRQIQISNEYIFVKQGIYGVAISLADIINIALTEEVNLTWTPPVALIQPANLTLAGNAAATGTLTGSGSTNVSDGDTVTIGSTVYRFKNTMAAINDVQIGGSGNSDTSLLNLIKAINLSGVYGTNYFAGTLVNPVVTAATSVTSHAFAITAKLTGLGGNAIATTKTSGVLAFGGSTMAGGSTTGSTMAITAGSEYTITYQWQYQTGGIWTNISGTTNGCPYTGYTTSTLATGTPTTQGQNGVLHRCLVTDNAGSYGLTNGVLTSNAVTLTIP